MSNSKLVNYKKVSPNSTNPRNHAIDSIVIHHMAGNLTVEACGDWFAREATQASANYGVGTDGRIALYVDENNRAWSTGNREIDNRAITIEVANCTGSPDWQVSDQAIESVVALCVDICKRYGFELNYTGDKTGNLQMHKWYAATACPGPYLSGKFQYIADEVNKRLGVKPDSKPSTKLVVDGKWGMDTTRRLQEIFGTPVDGIVSNQYIAYKPKNPGLVAGWDWKKKPNKNGSPLIKAMQGWAGATGKQVDGFWGNVTAAAIQAKLGTTVDGYVSNPSEMVKALQRWANNQ